jgi:hypothetical protein
MNANGGFVDEKEQVMNDRQKTLPIEEKRSAGSTQCAFEETDHGVPGQWWQRLSRVGSWISKDLIPLIMEYL